MTDGPDRSSVSQRLISGAAFILDAPTEPVAAWGKGGEVLWSAEEPLLIAGPPGTLKSTLAAHLLLRRANVLTGDLLGYPVMGSDKKSLLISADRPAQLARSMRRMVPDESEFNLNDWLLVHRGPVPEMERNPTDWLASVCLEHGVGTLVLDSLKDIFLGLASDEGGARTSQIIQACVAAGIDVIGIHHQRKGQSDNRTPRTLDDVYGSIWLTASAGSVVVLWGKAGDPVVQLLHLKQPADEVGPLWLTHDPLTGALAVQGQSDPLDLLRSSSNGLTKRELGRLMFECQEPDRSQLEKARRRLEGLTERGLAHKTEGSRGGPGGGVPDRYHAITQMEVVQ